MKTTNSKDLVKVNQILPIMQEHFGQSMNLARIKLMALLLHALCVVQTVSLHKLADAMPTAVDKDSNLRRLQRFFAKYVLDLDIIARMIFSLLPVTLARFFAAFLEPSGSLSLVMRYTMKHKIPLIINR